MIRPTTFATLTAAVALAGCTTVGDLPAERLGSATLTMANGVPVGTVQVLASGDNVTLAVAVTGIPQGTHGFHLHTTGSCEGPDFKSAGGHLNPTHREHGELNPAGRHFGDMPNLVVGPNRSASNSISLGTDREKIVDWLFDADGTAVVVHAGADDYKSDPAGDAGARIACGVLKRA